MRRRPANASYLVEAPDLPKLGSKVVGDVFREAPGERARTRTRPRLRYAAPLKPASIALFTSSICALPADSERIPFTSFAVADVNADYERLRAAGVGFTQPPTDLGPVTTAVFEDACGNLVQIAAQK